jgi:hypothetical protein
MPLPATNIAGWQSASRPLPCQVWIADLADYRAGLRGLLDEVELGRRQRYRLSADRRRFTMAAALLRAVAGRQLGLPARQVAIDRGCPDRDRQHGRPRVAATPAGKAAELSGYAEDRLSCGMADLAPPARLYWSTSDPFGGHGGSGNSSRRGGSNWMTLVRIGGESDRHLHTVRLRLVSWTTMVTLPDRRLRSQSRLACARFG